MAENKIELKSVSELLEMKFFIPSYQRGYRWTEQQVKDLLNDINEFDKTKDGQFYCLQPLVVHKNDDKELLDKIHIAQSINEVRSLIAGNWNVVDGQQRLTTIYLILKEIGVEPFTLQYSSKYKESCIVDIDGVCSDRYIDLEDTDDINVLSCINNNWGKFCEENKSKDNPEMYYLFLAKSIIHWWVNKNQIDTMEVAFQEAFKNRILNEVKFLWYDIDDADEHTLFHNLNSGKIALTNAELIKALFINDTKGDFNSKDFKQSIIADEFDQMEQAMRKDDMWYFLAGNQKKPSSCLDLLFNLMLDSSKDSHNYRDKDFRSFFFFKDGLNQKRDDVRWEKVKETFHILQGWHEDSEIFNLVGYLRATGTTLSDILKSYKSEIIQDKTSFKRNLRKQCCERIGDDYLSLRYDKHKDKVRKVLLLFNIAVLLEKPEEKARFSFESYHKYKWDVEHISPQRPERDALLKKLKEIDSDGKTLADKYPILNDLIDALEKNNEEKINQYFAIKDDDVMALKNLTLLSAHDNRGIGNNFFFIKRNMLKEYYQQGSYIPIGTLNVFSKFYAKNPTQPLFWDETDAVDYLNKIEETIKNLKDKL